MSSKAYFVDRGRDAADILTVAVGPGFGVDARVGHLSIGMGHFQDKAGLECGEFFYRRHARGGPEHLVWFGKFMDDLIPIPLVSGHSTVETTYHNDPGFKTATARHKTYTMGTFIIVPMFDYPKGEGSGLAKLYALTQIEAAVGLGGAFRIGCNPAELLDFVLGWTTLDIFADDIEKQPQSSDSQPTNVARNPARTSIRTPFCQ